MSFRIAVFLVLIACNLSWAQGIEFFHGTWQEALALAQKEEKPIFVDAFTTWCGPCKMMSQRVFPDPQVGDLYNAGFINVKLDMEKEEGLKFQQKYPVSAYPTLFYIDYNGAVLKKVVGAQQVDGFLQVGKAVLSTIDRSTQYAAEYEKGNRDPELVFNYIRALNKSGKSSLKVANEYLRSQKDLTTPQNLRIILEAAREADSRIFELLAQYRTQIAAISSEETVANQIYEACRRTADKGLEMKNPDLLAEAKEKMKVNYSSRAKAFAYQIDMQQAQRNKDEKEYLKALKSYVKSADSEPVKDLYRTAVHLRTTYADKPEYLQSAADLMGLAAGKAKQSGYYLSWAEILLQLGDKAGARDAAQKALELAEKENETNVARVEAFLEKL